MRALVVSVAFYTLFGPAARAVTVSVEGSINRQFFPPPIDESRVTFDYLYFHVPQPTQVTLQAQALLGIGFTAMQIYYETTGEQDPWNVVFNASFLLTETIRFGSVMPLLPAGNYAASAHATDTDWDIFEGIVPYYPAGPDADGFNYRLTLSGEIEPQRFEEGNFDGTWTVTVVPEPDSCGLLLAALTVLSRRRSRVD